MTNFFYQIEFREHDVVRVLNFEHPQNLPGPETLVGPEQAESAVEELVHGVDLLRPSEDFLSASAAQRQSLELDLTDTGSNLEEY